VTSAFFFARHLPQIFPQCLFPHLKAPSSSPFSCTLGDRYPPLFFPLSLMPGDITPFSSYPVRSSLMVKCSPKYDFLSNHSGTPTHCGVYELSYGRWRSSSDFSRKPPSYLICSLDFIALLDLLKSYFSSSAPMTVPPLPFPAQPESRSGLPDPLSQVLLRNFF